MAIKRSSTDLLRFFGAQITPGIAQDKILNIIKQGQGFEVPLDASLERIDFENNRPATINPSVFRVIKSYFVEIGATELNAKTMALLVIDAAQVQGVTALSLLGDIKNNTKINFDSATYTVLNQLRDPTSQLVIASSVNNSNSVNARNVLP